MEFAPTAIVMVVIVEVSVTFRKIPPAEVLLRETVRAAVAFVGSVTSRTKHPAIRSATYAKLPTTLTLIGPEYGSEYDLASDGALGFCTSNTSSLSLDAKMYPASGESANRERFAGAVIEPKVCGAAKFVKSIT